MLPFLAQGAAMAIEDAYVLAALLKNSTGYANGTAAIPTFTFYGRTRSIQL